MPDSLDQMITYRRKPKRLWLITILLLAGHLVMQYAIYSKPDPEELSLFRWIDLFGNIIVVFFIGALLGCLAALIPFRQMKFKEKFRWTFPLLTSLVLIILISTFGYVVYLRNVKNIELRPLHSYEKIQQ